MIEFRKMHGLGNDFVVLDSRRKSVNLSLEQIRLIADRHLGIGCDQIMIMHPAKTSGDIYLQMLNADGSEAGACGNGTRCVASILLSEFDKPEVHIETLSGVLSAYYKNNMIAVDMGPACGVSNASRFGASWEGFRAHVSYALGAFLHDFSQDEYGGLYCPS